jgi:hypothetical protein
MHGHCFRTPVALAIMLFAGRLNAHSTSSNLLANGSFENSEGNSQIPDFWSAAGNRSVKQSLQLDIGADGNRCARLECNEFGGSGGDVHAMICQVGIVSVRRGQWYRLRFLAKASGISGAVEVGLVNRRPWSNVGLDEVFVPEGRWKSFDFVFQAKEELPASTSRLQFWFRSTGTLWLDDVELTETPGGRKWFPQLSTGGVKNFLPNSSFECGAANWGSFTYGLEGWAGNLFRFEGEIDHTTAHDGKSSVRISSAPLPTFYFDYYEPIRQPVKRVLVANHGWVQAAPGEPLTLSAWVRGTEDGLKIELLAAEPFDQLQHKDFTIKKEWQRYQFTFKPSGPAAFIAVGPNFSDSKTLASVWIDSVQLERGDHATDYEPRQTIETFLEAQTNLFIGTNAVVLLTSHNRTATNQLVTGRLVTTDFFDRVAHETNVTLTVPPGSTVTTTINDLPQLGPGFFRTTWATTSATQSVRYALLPPSHRRPEGCPFGMNHAYPWDFLIRPAHAAGVVWWRDWSAKWNTVEPRKGQFDFSQVDPQIDRVLAEGGSIDALLPFPAASWSSAGSESEIAKLAGEDSGARDRLRRACLPRDLADFSNYATQVAEHFLPKAAVSHYEILNEPLYTDYALPRQLGYRLDDYIRMVRAAAPALHRANPKCQVVAGIGSGPDAELTRQFITDGGLDSADALDLHMYDPPLSADHFDRAFGSLENLMRQHGSLKPIWITEWGCYADDDPACLPVSVGDSTMNHCYWPSEQAATEDFVRFTAVSFAHGVRRIFFHAGVCGAINGPDAASIFFEYGGAPRKILAGAAAWTRLVGVPKQCLKIIRRNVLYAAIFETSEGAVAVTWSSGSREFEIPSTAGARAFDIMGKRVEGKSIILQQSPMYLQAPSAEPLIQAFAEATAK